MQSGVDISKDEFWQQGFDLVAAKVQELKTLD
jgi:oligoendopeptidase F